MAKERADIKEEGFAIAAAEPEARAIAREIRASL
jgi:hypothetical protein